MSPKGGIIPHKRFSVQSKRSEVLFVDYIAEHLTPTGRAAVIVPEGIIFQSARAYTQLRKILVEKYLYAVVSLPAGVFNPYSGVKTSILFMNRQIAAKAQGILFIKVENDGFDLGAQRRMIDRNDLPMAAEILAEYRRELFSRLRYPSMLFQKMMDRSNALIVPKETIAENGEYNLTGDRYRVTERRGKQKWPMVRLGDVCTFEYGKSLPEKLRKNGPYPVMGSNGRVGYHDEFLVKGPVIIIGRKGSSGEIVWEDNNCFPIDTTYYIIADTNKINLKWFYYILKNLDLPALSGGAGIPGLNRNDAYFKGIPLPPLNTQREIVAEIEGYQKIIDGARQVVDNWKPQGEVDPEWPVVELGDVCEVTSSKRIFQDEYVKSGIPFYRTKEIVELSQGKEISLSLFISKKKYINIKKEFPVPKFGDILISAVGTIGITWVIPDDREFYFKDGNLLWLREFKNVNPGFIKLILEKTVSNNLHILTNGAAYNAMTIEKLRTLDVLLPPLVTQQEIVSNIETERKTIDGCRELIIKYEEKIKKIVDGVWGE
jgi:type I restriction enzyme M protein